MCFRDLEQCLNQAGKHEMLGKETEYAYQAEGNEVMQTADISEHHATVVYDSLLASHLV